MRAAADRCMNIGLCRKAGSGTMCPSYMATRKEEDSTRGRAAALVKALSEPDPRAALGDERLHEVLDLCLMCKACKSECPLGVDMAILKSEALSHHHDIHGAPLRSRLFGSIRFLNRLGSATAPLSNLPGRIPLVRRLMDRTVGTAPARPLPVFVRHNLSRWFRRRKPATHAVTQGTVTYLADSSPRSPSRTSAGRPSGFWSGPVGTSGWRAVSAAGGPASPRAWWTTRRTRRAIWRTP